MTIYSYISLLFSTHPYIHSTDVVMKECSAYGQVAAHSGQTEDVYENPQWIDNTMHAVSV